MNEARCQRAAAFLPQNIGSRISGLIQSGYWVDQHHFFFCVLESADGRQRQMPMLFDACRDDVSPVISMDDLVALFAACGGEVAMPATLDLASYEMPDAGTLVVILDQSAYRINLAGPTLIEIVALAAEVSFTSPDGRYVCRLESHDLWLEDRTSGAQRALSTNGEAYFAYGSVPESGISPISSRASRVPVGLWSPDSQWFVSHRIDERSLPQGGLVEHVPAVGPRPVMHLYKVTGPDTALPRVEFVAWHLPSGRVVRTGDTTVIAHVLSPFTSRQCWLTDDQFYFLDRDRFSSTVTLMVMDLPSGAVRALLTETAECGWIDHHPSILGQPMVRPLHQSGELIWYSQRDGRGHLYLHDLRSGALARRITDGPWVVREIVHVDEARRRLLFLASGFSEDRDPVARRLCAIHFDGSGLETVFADQGDLSVCPDPLSAFERFKPFRPSGASAGATRDGRHVVVRLGDTAAPTRWLVIDTETSRSREIACVDIEAHWHAPKPQPFEALAADGKTRLFGAMYMPSDFDPSRCYPLVDYIYPGPQVNWHDRRFPNGQGPLLQSVVELGMVGIVLETRGMPNRDRDFHQAGRGRLHEPQLSDHVAVISQLCRRYSFLDSQRIGVFGQSGGGYASARALFDYPQVFKVGVSACGNHDNRSYNAHWMDKYGGRPDTPEREEQANITAAHKLRGKLLLLHGDMDENVHPGHTLALAAKLIAAGREFEQLILPGVTHGVFLDSAYAVQRLWGFFARHLLGQDVPPDFKLDWPPASKAAALRLQADDGL